MTPHYSEYQYDSLDPGNAGAGRRLSDYLIRIVEDMDGIHRICDLGCGNGYLSGRLAAKGYQVTGIDASESGIRLAGAAYISDRIEFICAAIDDDLISSIKDDNFDLVIASDVIEHLYRPSDLLYAAKRLLGPQGRLIITTPYHGYWKNLALSLFNKWDMHHGVNWDGGHIKFFSAKTLYSLVTGCGFEDVEFVFTGRFPYLWKNMICTAQKKNKK